MEYLEDLGYESDGEVINAAFRNPNVARRSAPFNEIELTALLNLVREYKDIIESTETDANSKRLKRDAWVLIEQRYASNAANLGIVVPRDKDQLKRRWTSLKAEVRKHDSEMKQSRLRTGGGPPPPELDEARRRLYDMVRAIKPSLDFTLENPYDSTAAYEGPNDNHVGDDSDNEDGAPQQIISEDENDKAFDVSDYVTEEIVDEKAKANVIIKKPKLEDDFLNAGNSSVAVPKTDLSPVYGCDDVIFVADDAGVQNHFIKQPKMKIVKHRRHNTVKQDPSQLENSSCVIIDDEQKIFQPYKLEKKVRNAQLEQDIKLQTVDEEEKMVMPLEREKMVQNIKHDIYGLGEAKARRVENERTPLKTLSQGNRFFNQGSAYRQGSPLQPKMSTAKPRKTSTTGILQRRLQTFQALGGFDKNPASRSPSVPATVTSGSFEQQEKLKKETQQDEYHQERMEILKREKKFLDVKIDISLLEKEIKLLEKRKVELELENVSKKVPNGFHDENDL